jgi:hypothetical protein
VPICYRLATKHFAGPAASAAPAPAAGPIIVSGAALATNVAAKLSDKYIVSQCQCMSQLSRTDVSMSVSCAENRAS